METNLPAGAKFLKVTGILMIIFGGLGILVSAAALVTMAALTAFLQTEGYILEEGILFIINLSSYFGMFGAVVQLISGIMGVVFSKKTEKANICLIMGVLIIIINVVGAVVIPMIAGSNAGVMELAAQTGVSLSSINYVGLFSGAAVPVLFIIGALKNKKG